MKPGDKRDAARLTPRIYAPAEDPDDGTTNELDTWWLPEPARDWCEAMAVAYGVPRTLPVAAAVCAAAAVLQGRTRVRLKEGWEEPLCLFWLLFVRTGGRKSEVMARATRALHAWQARRREEIGQRAREAAFEQKRHEAQLRRMRAQKRGSKYGPGHEEYSEWLGEIRAIERDLACAVAPVEPDLLHGDINPSLLPKVMLRNYEADGIARMAVLDDEGTCLANLLGRHQGQPILETPLKAYGGHWAKVVRASKEGDGYVRVELPHAYMTLCVFAQPHYHDLIAEQQLLSTSGFVGRCIVDVVGVRERVPWDAPPVPEGVQDAYDAWLLGLAEGDVPELVDLSSDPESLAALERCYGAVEADGSGTSQRIVGRVARIVAVVVAAGGVAPRAHPNKIDHLFELIYLKRIRQVTRIDQPADDLTTTARVTLATGRERRQPGELVTIRELQRTYIQRPRPRSEAIYRACDELAEAGYLEWDQDSRSSYRGRVRYRAVRFHHRPEPELRVVDPAPPDPMDDPAEDWPRE